MLNLIWLCLMTTIVAATYFATPVLVTIATALWWFYALVSVLLIIGGVCLLILSANPDMMVQVRHDAKLKDTTSASLQMKLIAAMAVFTYAGWVFPLVAWILFWMCTFAFSKAYNAN